MQPTPTDRPYSPFCKNANTKTKPKAKKGQVKKQNTITKGNNIFILVAETMPSSLRPCLFLVIPIFCVFLLILFPHQIASNALCKKTPIIFNFGDSNSDTGGLVAGLGYSVDLPYGRTFFRKSTGRLSDGRLLLDFLCESLKTSYLRPYLDSLGSNFWNGANFAIVGSTTLPKFKPFALNVQVMQFLHFKSRSLDLLTTPGAGKMINNEGFHGALYMIDIGQNDLADSFSSNLPYSEVVKKIPSILTEIREAIRAIYDQGGRKFWVHNTGPLGCLPQKLSLFQGNVKDFDHFGCISTYNSAASLFNEGLSQLCQELRTEMKDAAIVYVDIYTIKYDLIANASNYGFSSPLMACCGYGGAPYNYNINITCSHVGSNVCNQGSRFISWDGIHYSEAANSIIASKLLLGAYSQPSVAFDFFCN